MKKVRDLKWTRYVIEPLNPFDGPDINYVADVGDGIHRFSVLDRMTGYSFCSDIETAFMSLDRATFWLRTGQFDIRDYPDLSIEEGVVLLKSDAYNYCGPPRTKSRDIEP